MGGGRLLDSTVVSSGETLSAFTVGAGDRLYLQAGGSETDIAKPALVRRGRSATPAPGDTRSQ
jgi:hypothetical protein